jgi:hypothetical protein
MDGILCQSKSYCDLKIGFFSDFSVQGSERLSFHQCCVFQEHNSVLNMCVANIICFLKIGSEIQRVFLLLVCWKSGVDGGVAV